MFHVLRDPRQSQAVFVLADWQNLKLQSEMVCITTVIIKTENTDNILTHFKLLSHLALG